MMAVQITRSSTILHRPFTWCAAIRPVGIGFGGSYTAPRSALLVVISPWQMYNALPANTRRRPVAVNTCREYHRHGPYADFFRCCFVNYTFRVNCFFSYAGFHLTNNWLAYVYHIWYNVFLNAFAGCAFRMRFMWLFPYKHNFV